jgi:hypothetical protein
MSYLEPTEDQIQALIEAHTPEEIKEVLRDIQEAQNEAPVKTFEAIFERLAELEGVPIGTKDAAIKYDMSSSTIANWAFRGRIRVIEKDWGQGKQTTFNERDIAAIVTFNRENGVAQKAGRPRRFLSTRLPESNKEQLAS